jgi:hypothetical protein
VLNKAWKRYIDKIPMRRVKAGDRSWNYQTQTYTRGPSVLSEGAPSNIEAAIRDVVYEKEITADVATYQTLDKEYRRRKSIIETKAQEIEDIIVLGDQHAALIALQEFEAFEV